MKGRIIILIKIDATGPDILLLNKREGARLLKGTCFEYYLKSSSIVFDAHFYVVRMRENLVKGVQEAGWILTMEDLGNYKVDVIDALAVKTWAKELIRLRCEARLEGVVVAVECIVRGFYGLQYHPEAM
nr:gamma-glutamyltranspeptidase 3-like [Tanacetum cinerariifolium]